ncbi:MAG: ATP-binding protein [Ruminococcus sp.]|nr:ATP-binding protein [Candidatus Copronaster equi]
MNKTANEQRYRKRVMDSVIETYLQVSGAVCIEGPKWCGKTWTSSHHSNSEFLVGDPNNNFSNRQLAELNPSFILNGNTPRMIDEWQEVPAIWDAVRAEVDRRQKKGQIILTGSSTPKTKGIMHNGTGRIVSLRMNTMSLYETGDSSGAVSLKELCGGNLEMQTVKEARLDELAYFIVRGGFPENVAVPYDKAYIMPRAYMEGVIKEDLNKLDDGTDYNRQKVQLLLRSLARNESTTVSDSSILKDIAANDDDSMSRNTVARYIGALGRIFLFNNQEPFSPNFRSGLRVKQGEKRHFSDPSMAAALLNITPSKLLSDLNTFGFLFESLVEHDLSVYVGAFGGKLFHYQDYKGNEIDAVIELDDGDWCAFEIKLGAKKIDEGADNLIRVCDDIVKNGGKAPKIKCVICGLSNAAYQRQDGVFVVPITALKN